MSRYQVQLQRPYGVVFEAAQTSHHQTALRAMRAFIRQCQGRRDSLALVYRDGREVSYAQMRGDNYQRPPRPNVAGNRLARQGQSELTGLLGPGSEARQCNRTRTKRRGQAKTGRSEATCHKHDLAPRGLRDH